MPRTIVNHHHTCTHASILTNSSSAPLRFKYTEPVVCVCERERERETVRNKPNSTIQTPTATSKMVTVICHNKLHAIPTTQLVCFWQTQCVFFVKNTAIPEQISARACTAATPGTISHQLQFLILRRVTDLTYKYTRQPNENIKSEKNTGRIRLPNHLPWHTITEDRLTPSSKTSLRTHLPNQLP